MKYHYNSIGHFESITDSNGHELYRTAKTTAMGQTERFVMGGDMVSEREYHPEKHTLTHIHTARGENILQDLWYDYDGFGNLAVRKDNMRDLEEIFTYDHLNRLTGITLNGSLTGDMGYDPYGRMKNKVSDNAFVFSAAVYDRTSKPHAIDAAKTRPGVFPAERQRITYTCFDKVKTIEEDGKTLEYAYGHDRQRIGMTEQANGVVRTKRYVGACEFVTQTDADGTSKVTYTFLTAPTGVFAVVETLGDGKHYPHYVLKDHLGSWTTITDADGTVEREQSFDAWGNLRDPETWTGTATEEPMYDRGFTGHEHITAFGLINMNGRCYDPVTSSFLSVDAYIQSPDNSQSFNRYSYCQNNPLRYTDPTGWQQIGGTTPRPQGFYTLWGDYYSRPAYEPRDFGLKQLSDVNPDIAWMEANEMRGGCSFGSCQNGFYDSRGNYLGSDGKNGNKVYVLRSEIPSVMANMTEITRFFEKGVSSLTIDEIYGSFVEILPSRVGRYRMYDIVSQDNGKGGVAECNNREYGGFINEVGMVIELPHGEPKIPSNNKVTIDFPHGKEYATFHSHPSGNGASYIKDGEIRTPIFQQYPTEDDIGITGNHICYVFGRRDGNVYVYNGQGVQTIIRASDFISFTKFRRP